MVTDVAVGEGVEITGGEVPTLQVTTLHELPQICVCGHTYTG